LDGLNLDVTIPGSGFPTTLVWLMYTDVQ